MQELAIVSLDGNSPPLSLTLKAVVQPPIEILPYPAVFLSAFFGERKKPGSELLTTTSPLP
jgi:hypothetical protein